MVGGENLLQLMFLGLIYMVYGAPFVFLTQALQTGAGLGLGGTDEDGGQETTRTVLNFWIKKCKDACG